MICLFDWARKVIKTAALILPIALASGVSAQEESKDPSRFFGTYTGDGLVRFDPRAPAAGQLHDGDLAIAPGPDGRFSLTWEVVANGGQSEARRTVVQEFAPSGRPGVFQSTEEHDPFAAKPVTWARVDSDELHVYSFEVLPDGDHLVTHYLRRLGDGAMELEFTAVTGAGLSRIARGLLVERLN